MIPLILRLKKENHKEIARAQDIMIKALYELFNNAVLHGGTSIWRCYKGNRFSEDIDVYLKNDKSKINSLFELFQKRGLVLERKKISNQSIYSTLKFNRTLVRFEAIFKKEEGMLKDYESSDGTFITVYTLSPEELIKEKVATYLKRFKIRDLYDIFFLLRYVEDIAIIRQNLNELLDKFKKPLDEKDLRVIILEGLVPDTEKMLDYIKGKL